MNASTKMDERENPPEGKRTFRRAITIRNRQIAGAGLHDFPVYVSFQDPLLRSRESGGHVAQASGSDIYFTAVSGTVLPHEVERYEPESGQLQAWVRVPHLRVDAETHLYLNYGEQAATPAPDRDEVVWDAGYWLVMHKATSVVCDTAVSVSGEDADLCGRPDLLRSLTVEAWVHTEKSQAEALQFLVSRWNIQESFDHFTAYDAGCTEGLETKGYYGSVFDGRYVYFVPQYDGTSNHGKVLRYDTQSPFDQTASWDTHDAGHTSGLHTVGYYGAVFDGRYVYFVPRIEGNFTPESRYHSRILRHDTRVDFHDPASWQAFDLGLTVSYQGAVFDGRYIYFCPGFEQPPGTRAGGAGENKLVWSGKVLRYDTTASFIDGRSYAIHDASGTSGLDSRCYDGGVFDGRYVYFVPLESNGVVLRYDTLGDFSSQESWLACDSQGMLGVERGWSVGAVFDGRYIYFVPYSTSATVRYDTHAPFTELSSWSAMVLSDVCGLQTRGYDGGVFDGRYVYFIPFYNGGDLNTGFHGTVLRYDTTSDFLDEKSWSAQDSSLTSGLRTVGFNGASFDGRFIYFCPHREGSRPGPLPMVHGRVLRYDTTGPSASFSLRYCDYGHNGGLCGALPGPSFLINTDEGVRSVQANRALAPGSHHIAGIYDGAHLTLLIDGTIAAQRKVSGQIQYGAAGFVIGSAPGGQSRFDGQIEEIRVSSVARSQDWLKSQFHNFADPKQFGALGQEEVASA